MSYIKHPKLRPFQEKQKLDEMLELRRQGWSLTFIAKKYGINHASVIYQCKKHKVFPLHELRKSLETEDEIRKRKIQRELMALHFEPINPGKTYAEYIDERKAKKNKILFNIASKPSV